MKILSMLAGILSLSAVTLSDTAIADGKRETDLYNGIVMEGRTMLPLRDIFETLDASVNWDAETQEITAQRGETTIRLTIDSNDVFVNGERITADAAPMIYEGRTRVPVRLISETLDAAVDWDGEDRVARVETDDDRLHIHVNGTIQGNDLIVHVNDPTLKRDIRNRVFGPAGFIDSTGVSRPNPNADQSGPITQKALDQLRGISFDSELIKDIRGLQYARELDNIYLSTPDLEHTGIIQEMPWLEEIYLLPEHLDDPGILSPIASLENLAIQGDAFNEIDALADALSDNPNLKRLSLQSLGIRDISGLGSLAETGSLENLDLSGNDVTDIHILSEFPQLKLLNLGANPVADLSPVGTITDLERLWLHGMELEEIRPLENLRELILLDISANAISDLGPLHTLQNLRFLEVNSNELRDLNGLEGLASLLTIEANGNRIEDISALAQTPNLTTLSLQHNHIKDLTPLSQADQLGRVELQHNRITHLRGLETLHKMSTLHVTGNEISNLSPLQHLNSLRNLYASDNQISDVTPLSNVPELRNVEMNANTIQHLSPLSSFDSRLEVIVFDNPLDTSLPLFDNAIGPFIYYEGNDIPQPSGPFN